MARLRRSDPLRRLQSNLSCWWRRFSSTTLTQRSGRFRPRLEVLEERATPAIFAPLSFAADGASDSLRAAVVAANANADEVNTFNLGVGIYRLSVANSAGQENLAAEGDLDLTGMGRTYVFQGSGIGVSIIDAAALDRVFHVFSGVNLVLRDLSVTGGLAVDDGAAGRLPGESDARGGGLLNDGGTVTLEDVVLIGNFAQGADGPPDSGQAGGRAQGGGLFSAGGQMTLQSSFVISNAALGGAGSLAAAPGVGGDGEGGGVYVAGGSVSIVQTTFNTNVAQGGTGGAGAIVGTPAAPGHAGGGGGSGRGGGLLIVDAMASITQSLWEFNTAHGGEGGAGSSAGDPLNLSSAGNGSVGGAGGQGGVGGDGWGGALLLDGGQANIQQTDFRQNSAGGGRGGAGGGGGGGQGVFGIAVVGGTAGIGGEGGSGGVGGASGGAAVFAQGDTLMVTLGNTMVLGNESLGGGGGRGGDGGPGGGVGGIDIVAQFAGNGGIGGVGGVGGASGAAAILVQGAGPTLTLSDTPVSGNASQGGGGGIGGDGGAGGGVGGINSMAAGGDGGNGGNGGDGGAAQSGALQGAPPGAPLTNSPFVQNRAFGSLGGAAGLRGAGSTSGSPPGTAGMDGSPGADFVLYDFGDAPAPYPTTLAENGPRHLPVGPLLGAARDEEADAVHSALADGDDAASAPPDDEDAVSAFPSLFTAQTTYTVTVAVANETGGDANLVGWIDFDRNGVFDTDEAAVQTVPHGATMAMLTWNDIGGAGPDIAAGDTFARFRISTDALALGDVGGAASDGEVEDYPLTISVNQPPTANPGGSYEVVFGDDITLDGGGSFDPDAALGDAIAFHWQIGAFTFDTAAPVMSGVQVSTLGLGQHAVDLTVTDQFGLMHSAQTTLTVNNLRPIAMLSAGPNPAALAQSILLDGSGSFHGNAARSIVQYTFDFGDGSTYTETAASAPDGAFDGRTTHSYSRLGDFSPTLTITDDDAPPRTGSATTAMTVNQGGLPPVADAGGPYTIQLGEALELDGGGSTDPDLPIGDMLVQFDWDLNLDSVTDVTGVAPNVSAGQLASLGLAGGPHTIRLTVTDFTGQSRNDTAIVEILDTDFGDAPDSYRTTLAAGGPRHGIVGPRLGLLRDAESDAAAPLDGDGDDAQLADDEDGVTIPLLANFGLATIVADITGSAGDARLYGWIDLNGDGDFADAGEQIADGEGIFAALSDGPVSVNVAVPPSATTGPTYARFRVATQAGLSFDGAAADGEVEDYAVEILPASPRTNLADRYNVDAVGDAGFSDVLALLADLRTNGAYHVSENPIPPPPYSDVDGNYRVNFMDILAVITHLRTQATGGEGEAGSSFATISMMVVPTPSTGATSGIGVQSAPSLPLYPTLLDEHTTLAPARRRDVSPSRVEISDQFAIDSTWRSMSDGPNFDSRGDFMDARRLERLIDAIAEDVGGSWSKDDAHKVKKLGSLEIWCFATHAREV
ncbi:MAG: GEVED domain-containing protein [Pirellulaceae bacterium]